MNDSVKLFMKKIVYLPKFVSYKKYIANFITIANSTLCRII